MHNKVESHLVRLADEHVDLEERVADLEALIETTFRHASERQKDVADPTKRGLSTHEKIQVDVLLQDIHSTKAQMVGVMRNIENLKAFRMRALNQQNGASTHANQTIEDLSSQLDGILSGSLKKATEEVKKEAKLAAKITRQNEESVMIAELKQEQEDDESTVGHALRSGALAAASSLHTISLMPEDPKGADARFREFMLGTAVEELPVSRDTKPKPKPKPQVAAVSPPPPIASPSSRAVAGSSRSRLKSPNANGYARLNPQLVIL